MKRLMTEWRSFLREGYTRYSGILMMKPGPVIIKQIQEMQETLPANGKRIKEEDLHITLIHQNILNVFKEEMKDIELPDPPPIKIEPRIFQRKSPGKESWAVRIINQGELKDYVRRVMELLGSQNTNPEPERVFHITVGNLTGNPYDSVQ